MRAKVRMGSICLPAQESRNVELVLFRVRRGLPAKSIERLVRWALGVLGHRGHGSAGSSRNGGPRCIKPRRRGHSGTALGPVGRSGGWAYRPNVRSGLVRLFSLVAPAETHGSKPPQQAAFALLRMLCVRMFTSPPAPPCLRGPRHFVELRHAARPVRQTLRSRWNERLGSRRFDHRRGGFWEQRRLGRNRANGYVLARGQNCPGDGSFGRHLDRLRRLLRSASPCCRSAQRPNVLLLCALRHGPLLLSPHLIGPEF